MEEKEPTTESGVESVEQDCQEGISEMRSKYMYLQAEFENYKKRTEKERTAWTEMAQDQALLDLIGVFDDLERALHEFEGQQVSEQVAGYVEGVSLIKKNVEQLLVKYQLQEIVPGKEFDPRESEAVMQQASDEHAQGEVVFVVQKGYKRNDRVLRPAKVAVAS